MAGASRNVDPDSPFVIDEGSPSLSGLEGHYGQDDLDGKSYTYESHKAEIAVGMVNIC